MGRPTKADSHSGKILFAKSGFPIAQGFTYPQSVKLPAFVQVICRPLFTVLIIAMICLVGGMASAGPPLLKSQYTSIKSADCKKVAAPMAEAFHSRGLEAEECPAPKGWRLFVVSTNERSWLEIAYERSLWTTEEEVVYNNQFGHFPNIGADRIEWRVTKSGTPVALIFRIAAQDPDKPAIGADARTLSRLFVIGLAEGIPRFCGIAKSNQDARNMADNQATCRTMLKKVSY